MLVMCGPCYLFKNHAEQPYQRNLLVFVTPYHYQFQYGTGLEDQVSGLHHVGEEYSDINGWRTRPGRCRLVPTVTTSGGRLSENWDTTSAGDG